MEITKDILNNFIDIIKQYPSIKYSVYAYESDNGIYVGMTSNIYRRTTEHFRDDGVKSGIFIPSRFIVYEEYTTKKEALTRERELMRVLNYDLYIKMNFKAWQNQE